MVSGLPLYRVFHVTLTDFEALFHMKKNLSFGKSIVKYYFQERVICENAREISLGQMVAEV